MKMSVFTINKGRKTIAFTDFTEARANAIKLLKERKRDGEVVESFKEKVCPLDYDRSKHTISMCVTYKSWQGGWRHKRYSVTIVCYGTHNLAPGDPIFRM